MPAHTQPPEVHTPLQLLPALLPLPPLPAGGAAWWRSLARLAGFVACVEALRRTFFSDHTVQALLAAQPWQAWGVGYCLLAALFAQSYGECGS